MADKIAMDEVVFQDIYDINVKDLITVDDYSSNQDTVQNVIYSDVQQTETIDKYLLCTNMIICMLRDCYDLCEQATHTFKEIGDNLKELDDTLHITLYGEEAYYGSIKEEQKEEQGYLWGTT